MFECLNVFQAYHELRLNDEMRLNDVVLSPVSPPKHSRAPYSPPDTAVSSARTLMSSSTDMAARKPRPRWEQHLDQFGWCWDSQVASRVLSRVRARARSHAQ